MSTTQIALTRSTTEAASASQKPSRKKFLLPLVLALAALLLTACGWQGVGTVTGKSISEGYWYSTSYCAAYDAKGMCSMTMYQQNWMPDTYNLDIAGDTGETHSVSVNKAYWDAANEGDHFDNRDEK